MYLGIDFGTSFSQISTMYLGQPLLLLNPGEYGVPSEFYYDRTCGVLVGQDALDAGQGQAAANLVSEVKMDILSGKTFLLDRKTFTAKDIVKEIYKSLILKAVQVAKKRTIDAAIEGVVISVPAKFGMQERLLISEAARECLGRTRLPIRAIIKEPVAAAIAYYNTTQLKNNTHVLVYDLGGGTCDVALVRSDASVAERYTVVDSDMVRLGGRNWDEALMQHITQVVEKQSGLRIQGNPGYEEKIRRAAISAKHDLSDPGKARAIARVELNGRIYMAPITRVLFEEVTAHLLRQTLDCLQEVYDRNRSSCQIDEIICVGGSSNMLQVEAGLRKRFPQCKIRLYEPEHAVVNGATIYANMPSKMALTDIASFTYGTECTFDYNTPRQREMVSNILKKGTSLPTVNKKYYTPQVNGQKEVNFAIYESEFLCEEFDFDDPNKRHVGTVKLVLPPNATTDLLLTCQIGLNREGLLEVEASEPSGRKIQASFQVQSL